MTPRERIAILLHHYRDVCEGIYTNPAGEDDVGRFLMCRTWNEPPYQQLERLLREMHQTEPRLRQALRVRYERYSERRVAWCRKCGSHPADHVGRVHAHPPGRAVALKPRVVRSYTRDDRPELVARAEMWLEERFPEFKLYLPSVIMEIEAERSLRDAA